MHQHIRNASGISIVETMVALAIMSIGSLAFMTMMSSQQNETRSVTEKLASIDLQRVTGSALSDSTCTFMMTHASQSEAAVPPNRNKSTFDSTNAAESITLQRVPSSGSAVGAANPVAVVGQAASANSNSVIVQSITVSNFTNVSTDLYSATISIGFDPARLIRAIKPISFTAWFSTTAASPANAKVINACTMTAPPVAVAPNQGFCTPTVDFDNTNTMITCPARTGYTVRRYTGVYTAANSRQVSCCYIPDTAGSKGWCRGLQGWSGSFSGCGASTANYAVIHVNGVHAGQSDVHFCCFVPQGVANIGPTDVFGTSAIRADDGSTTPLCGPATHTYYDVLTQHAVTGSVGRMFSCTWVSK